MEALKEVFLSAGSRSVRTYIQSGNVLFEAPKGRGDALRLRIEKKVRSAGELRRLVEAAPFEAASRGKAKLIEKELGVPATTRNWNTVTRIADLSREVIGKEER